MIGFHNVMIELYSNSYYLIVQKCKYNWTQLVYESALNETCNLQPGVTVPAIYKKKYILKISNL